MSNLKRSWLITFIILVLWLLAGEGAAQQMPPVDPALANSKQFQRWWWAFQQRAYPLGDIPTDAKVRAFRRSNSLRLLCLSSRVRAAIGSISARRQFWADRPPRLHL